MVMCVGRADEVTHLVVGENDVACFLRIRQADQPDFPRLPILNAFVVLPCLFQRCAQAPADPVDRGGLDLAKQAIAPISATRSR
ncbi:hypothetical protein [Bradyrhizobium sp. 147]|uniref:hypothetical protein n=1 Tax=Bradyrhizobium sp. 147 TaxID=2782623 RepID=UPI001FF7AF09|nr:hypothetical protein [Bradyrhizobium sp. 147]